MKDILSHFLCICSSLTHPSTCVRYFIVCNCTWVGRSVCRFFSDKTVHCGPIYAWKASRKTTFAFCSSLTHPSTNGVSSLSNTTHGLVIFCVVDFSHPSGVFWTHLCVVGFFKWSVFLYIILSFLT